MPPQTVAMHLNVTRRRCLRQHLN